MQTQTQTPRLSRELRYRAIRAAIERAASVASLIQFAFAIDSLVAMRCCDCVEDPQFVEAFNFTVVIDVILHV